MGWEGSAGLLKISQGKVALKLLHLNTKKYYNSGMGHVDIADSIL